MATCLLGIGANLGDRSATLDAAVDRLTRDPRVRVERCSRWHETAAIGGPASQPGFLNGAIVVETTLTPRSLLQLLHEVELGLGRDRPGHWHPRTIDLDLLLYDQLLVTDVDLVLPHPRMAVRRFVLEPAAEIAPDFWHPATGWTISQLLTHLNTAHQYAAVASSSYAQAKRLAVEIAKRAGAQRIELEPSATTLDAAASSTPAGWLELAHTWARELDIERWPRAAAPRGSIWVVSSGWFAESRLLGELDRRARGAASSATASSWRTLNARVVQPKLIIWVESRGAYAVAVDELSAAKETFATALTTELSLPRHAPVLRLEADDWDRAVIEAVAALEAAT